MKIVLYTSFFFKQNIILYCFNESIRSNFIKCFTCNGNVKTSYLLCLRKASAPLEYFVKCFVIQFCIQRYKPIIKKQYHIFHANCDLELCARLCICRTAPLNKMFLACLHNYEPYRWRLVGIQNYQTLVRTYTFIPKIL
jgi:hypothetical protein